MRRGILVVMVLSALCHGQDYIEEISIVRNILDSNKANVESMDAITKSENGHLISLDLSNKSVAGTFLKTLPAEIGKLTSLRVLILKNNELRSLPPEIGNLTDLKELDLGSNDLTSLPSTLVKLAALEKLDLRNNELREFPAEIFELKSLWYLHLRGNNLTSVPEQIGAMSSLKELYLQNNRLTTLPKAIMKLDLRYYELLDNKLCALPADLDAWMKKKDKRYRDLQKCAAQ